VDSWRAAYPGMIPQEILDGLSVEARAARWEEALTAGGPREVNLVAEDGGRIVGFASAGPSSDEDEDPGTTALLHAIYLDGSAWGHGVGTALLEAVTRRLREIGYEQAALWVIEANERARRFYGARGWTADGKSTECFGMDVRVDAPTLRYRRALG